MKCRTMSLLSAAVLALTATHAWAQRATLAIGDVKVNDSVMAAATSAGKANSVRRVAEAMDSVLIERFNATRKFEIIARSDLDSILKDQGFQGSGNVDLSDPRVAQAFKIRGVEYLVVTTISDFQDVTETATFEAIGEKAMARNIRYVATVKIWDTTRASLKEAATIPLKRRLSRDVKHFINQDGEPTDELLFAIAQELGDRVVNRVVDVIYPARIIARTDRQVTINRGDGTGIASGQTWDVYALGEEMIDPDTQESLGREEVRVGKVRVTQVLPKFAKAEVVEDLGVDKDQIVRPVLTSLEDEALQ